jgi:hypothetical protein
MFKKVRVAVLAILTCWIFVSVPPAVSQIDDVQAAIAQKDHLGALRILSAISDEASTPDTYLCLGIHANLRLCKRALEAFREGFNRYPTDPRFHSEGVAFYRRISLGSGRRRAEGQLLFSVPLQGLLFVELGGVWRSEQWDIPSQGRFSTKPAVSA